MDGLAAILLHKAFKAIRNIEGGSSGPRRTGGSAFTEEERFTPPKKEPLRSKNESSPTPNKPPPILRDVSIEQLDLAASIGDSNGQLAARKAVAEAFYRQHGFDDARIKSELRGIDLNKPVKVRLSPPPEEVVQWQPKGVQGRYFGNIEEGARPRQLGIGEFGLELGPPPRVTPKVQSLCRIKKGTPMLESTASKINDDWSVRSGQGAPFTIGDHGMIQGTSGGATQYFIPDKSAISFKEQ